MDVRIRPHALAGAVTPPPSKSMAHRLLLAAALADGVSTVKNVALYGGARRKLGADR